VFIEDWTLYNTSRRWGNLRAAWDRSKMSGVCD